MIIDLNNNYKYVCLNIFGIVYFFFLLIGIGIGCYLVLYSFVIENNGRNKKR